MKLLEGLGTFFYRRPTEIDQIASPRDLKIKYSLVVLLSTVFLAIVASIFLPQLKFFQAAKISTSIARSEWHFTLTNSQDLCHAADCLASPEQSFLWNAPALKPQSEMRESLLKNGQNEIWLGLVLHPDKIAKWSTSETLHLYLGHIRGPHTLFVDGKVVHLSNKKNILPLSLELGPAHNQNNRPIYVAIKVINTALHPDVLMLNGEVGEGLISSETLEALSLSYLVRHETIPTLLAFLYFLLSCVAFYFWQQSKRPEVFYFFFMNAIQTLVQMRYHIVFITSIDLTILRSLALTLRLAECTALLFFCMAMARTSRKFFAWIALTSLLFLSAVLLYRHDYAFLIDLENKMVNYIVPFYFVLSIAIVLLQTIGLAKKGSRFQYHPQRAAQLAILAVATAILGIVFRVTYEWSFVGRYNYTTSFFTYRMGYFVYTLLMIYLMTKEFIAREDLIRKTPVSRFHKMTPLLESIEGIVVTLDLKNSETLYKLRAKNSGPHDFVSQWRNETYQHFIEQKAVILSQAGDEVTAFFAFESLEDEKAVYQRVFTCLEKYDRWLGEFQRECQLRLFEFNLKEYKFSYRAAIIKGALRPYWEFLGETRVPAWTEAGNTTPLVDVHRYLEMEKGLNQSGEVHMAIIPTDLLDQILALQAELRPRVLFTHSLQEGKHGVMYDVSALRLSTQ